MKKAYRYNGETYNFDDVRVEAGMFYGRCVTKPRNGKWAWLDPQGFQFERERRVDAEEVPVPEEPKPFCGIPPGYHYWGGELRNNEQWRKRWR